MKRQTILSTVVVSFVIGHAALSVLAAESESVEQLRQQMRELDQKIRNLEQKQTTPLLSAGASGFALSSADSNFVAQLHGLIQLDNRLFFGSEEIAGNDSLLLRRVRPILQGTLFQDFDFMFVPEFGGAAPQVFDAYFNYRYQPWLQLRAGKFKVPIGLEHLQSDPVTTFSERSLVTDLVPNRDLGIQLWGDGAGGRFSYAVGIFNGVGDGRSSGNLDFEDHREAVGRLFLQPFKNSSNAAWLQGLSFGVGASWGTTSSNAAGLPNNNGYATDGQQLFFAYNPVAGSVVADGEHWRISPQLTLYRGPFSLLGEYAISQQEVRRTAAAPLVTADLRHTAFQVTAGWVLTGENSAFNGVVPRTSFQPSAGQWGAFQLVARYAELRIDDDTFPLFANQDSSAQEARAFGVGLNWYLNRNVRVSTSYAQTQFSGGGQSAAATAPAAITRQTEQVWFTRLQLSF